MFGLVSLIPSFFLMAVNTWSNPFIYPHTRFADNLEADYEKVESQVSERVTIGKGYGTGVVDIRNSSEEGLVPFITLAGNEYKLFPETRTSDYCYYASVSLLDLDSDGKNEILVHDGDGFCLYIYGVEGGKPVLLGEMSCNSGIILTEDGLLVTRIGSQGLAEFAFLKDGELKILKEFSIDLGEEAKQPGKNQRSVPLVYHEGNTAMFGFSFDEEYIWDYFNR